MGFPGTNLRPSLNEQEAKLNFLEASELPSLCKSRGVPKITVHLDMSGIRGCLK